MDMDIHTYEYVVYIIAIGAYFVILLCLPPPIDAEASLQRLTTHPALTGTYIYIYILYIYIYTYIYVHSIE